MRLAVLNRVQVQPQGNLLAVADPLSGNLGGHPHASGARPHVRAGRPFKGIPAKRHRSRRFYLHALLTAFHVKMVIGSTSVSTSKSIHPRQNNPRHQGIEEELHQRP